MMPIYYALSLMRKCQIIGSVFQSWPRNLKFQGNNVFSSVCDCIYYYFSTGYEVIC